MSYQSLAFFTGLFGSLHCVAMCGPLVVAIPFPGGAWYSLVQKIIYQLGRILTYSFLGFIAGSLGSLFNILGLQQALSFVSGSILLIIAFYHFSGHTSVRTNKFYQKVFTPLAKFMGTWMSKPYGGFFAGLLHGLIPCGMVYMAIAGSLNTGSSFSGSEFMFYFGLGTTPLLLLSSMIALVLKKFRAPRLMIPALFLIAGSFLIVRSLNVHIPFVTSPVSTNTEVSICN
ncbi:sulfite exporter TauE/SafE family protein [Daejeonella sp.]|uniref:sulfite exporter TauE/SafE family protein n=1 Tax=Daejeonella sp. TaxID=2805397 RepID=UPI0030C63E28